MNIEYEAIVADGPSSSSMAARRGNRGRAVVDPWATDDDGDIGNAAAASASPIPTAPKNDVDMSPRERRRRLEREERDRRDALVDRVRSNQVRLRRSSISNNDARRNTNDIDDVDDDRKRRRSNVHPDVNIIPRDYYDEDDEGYEGGRNIVSPRPAGGTGRRIDDGGTVRGEIQSSSSSSSLSSRGGGIFSNRRRTTNDVRDYREYDGRHGGRELREEVQNRGLAGAASPMNDVRGGDGSGDRGGGRREVGVSRKNDDDDDARDVPVKKRTKEVRLAPLRDDDGNEMFLTLEQADKIVKGILSSYASSSSSSSLLEDGSIAPDEDVNEDGDVIPVVNRWEDIGITDTYLLRNLRSPDALSCPCPLPVQDRACPAIVSMNDVLVSTHTGSGKTLAFLAPIAQGLLMDGDDDANAGGRGSGAYPRAMIVAPGRELASQIVSVARALFADTGLSVELAIGGTPYSRNVEKLRKTRPDVVVGVSSKRFRALFTLFPLSPPPLLPDDIDVGENSVVFLLFVDILSLKSNLSTAVYFARLPAGSQSL
jgi:hypothetical protein